MKRLWMAAPLAALVLVGGSAAAACAGGGGELSLQEYFQRLDRIQNDLDQRQADIESESPEALGEVEPIKDASQSFLALLKEALDDVDSLNPPAEAQEAHDEFVSAIEKLVEVNEGLTQRIEAIESRSELRELFIQLENDPEFSAAGEGVGKTCKALQDIAKDNGIGVDLACEEE